MLGTFRERGFRLGLACTMASMALLLVAPAAIAQSGDDAPASQVEVVAVDMSTSPQTVLVRSDELPESPAVSVNDRRANVTGVLSAADAGYRMDNVVVIDNSSTSATRIAEVRSATAAFFSSLAPGERTMLMSLPYKIEVPFSTDAAALAA